MKAWPMVALGDLFDIARGGSPRPIDDYITEDVDGVNWVSISDASESSKYIESTRRRIRPEGVRRSRQVSPGDFLLTNSMSFGRPYIMRTAGCIHDGWLVLAKKGGDVNQDFFFHLLGSQAIYAEFARLASGVTVKNLNIDLVRSVNVPVPPIAEQRRIAAILDKVDDLRAKRCHALAQLDRLAQSMFLDMFGDPLTNPKGWSKQRLGAIFDIARGGSPRPIDDYITDAPAGVNWVMIGDTEQGGKYIYSTKKKIRQEGVKRSRKVKSGDFLLTNSMSFGRPYIMRTDGCIHDGWLVLSPQVGDFNADYFYTLLGSPAVFSEFSRRAAGATVKNLNIELVSDVEVAVPPLEQQREFSAVIEAIERMKSGQERAHEHLSALFKSIQTRAFQGDL